MSNATLHKGNYLVLGADFQGYDGSPDVVTAMSVNVTPGGALLVEPVSAGPGNREVYVSIPVAATFDQPGVRVDMVVQVPGPGGVTPAQKFVSYTIDTVVPPDLRGATTRSIAPEQPLPHP